MVGTFGYELVNFESRLSGLLMNKQTGVSNRIYYRELTKGCQPGRAFWAGVFPGKSVLRLLKRPLRSGTGLLKAVAPAGHGHQQLLHGLAGIRFPLVAP